MAFLPLQFEDGKITRVKLVSSATVAKGDSLVDDGNGYYQRATSSATVVPYIALEAKTAGAAENPFIMVLETRGVRFVADTNATPVQTDVGTTADLTDHDTLNESSSTNDVFFIEEIKGAASDKKVYGYFIRDKAS